QNKTLKNKVILQKVIYIYSYIYIYIYELFGIFFFQRRNWTPQAVLYLKGARKANIYSKKKKKECRQSETGHRSTLERSSREEGDALQLGASHIYLFIHLFLYAVNVANVH
uniref:Uncharacterized protein n=1 Tax=Poecilia reticulata TaxID=8081 RepID=A0A3P9NQH8_POERE